MPRTRSQVAAATAPAPATATDRSAGFGSLDDATIAAVLRFVTCARDAKAASLVCKRWLRLSREEWERRAACQLAAEGTRWRPPNAVEIECAETKQEEDITQQEIDDLIAKMGTMPWVHGWGAAPSAGMWTYTAPHDLGGENVEVRANGEAQRVAYGSVSSVMDYTRDSMWIRGFVNGVMCFRVDPDSTTCYYPVSDRPFGDDLDPKAVVAQYPLAVEGPSDPKVRALGGMVAVFNEGGRVDARPPYCIGGRLLRMSPGSSEQAVMASLGFKRNEGVQEDDYDNDARWCRLPTGDGVGPPVFGPPGSTQKCPLFTAMVVPAQGFPWPGEEVRGEEGEEARVEPEPPQPSQPSAPSFHVGSTIMMPPGGGGGCPLQ